MVSSSFERQVRPIGFISFFLFTTYIKEHQKIPLSVRTEADRTLEEKLNSLRKGVGCLNNMKTNQGHVLRKHRLGIPVDRIVFAKIQLEILSPMWLYFEIKPREM